MNKKLHRERNFSFPMYYVYNSPVSIFIPTRLSICLAIGLILRELYIYSVSSGMDYGVVLSFAGALEDRELDVKSHADCWDLFSHCRFNGLCVCKGKHFK